VTNTGKRIFENPATGRQVIEDIKGGYFRIFQPKTIGSQEGEYLNLMGRKPAPWRMGKAGPVRANLTKGEMQRETHFLMR
jgi:hypothetical protein